MKMWSLLLLPVDSARLPYRNGRRRSTRLILIAIDDGM